ncbi:hypothetical protein V2W30_11915 [Streptomyces sp. Q6]|uniref:Uncharacterized protein n=1 Tax=Streptomyces citrinus TaxID=3118173 RepID=A0ACD5A9V4_9ACTN
MTAKIVVTPPPDGDHEDSLNLIMKQVIGRSRTDRTDRDFSGNKGLKLPSGGHRPRNPPIPDGTFAPTELRLFRDTSSVTPHSDPAKGDHRQSCTLPFGKALALPAPFGFDLETDEFR